MTRDTAARRSTRRDRWVVAGLLALTVVPVLAGTVRLVQLATGADLMSGSERYFDSPIPVTLHIVTAIVFAVLGALQFLPGLRRRRRWHRLAGRVVAPTGVVVALTGLWMTLFYPRPANDSDLLASIRIVVVLYMLISLVLGFAAIRRRDFVRHRAWMIRGYAIAMGAGTQVFTLLPWTVAVGEPAALPRALLMAAAWVINAVLAEWIIRRPARRRPRPSHRRPVVPVAVPAEAVAR
jgi:uncharacterized membrane protein YozB (DUF420 family)